MMRRMRIKLMIMKMRMRIKLMMMKMMMIVDEEDYAVDEEDQDYVEDYVVDDEDYVERRRKTVMMVIQ